MPLWSGPFINAEKIQVEKGSFHFREQGVAKKKGQLTPLNMDWYDLELRLNGIRSDADSIRAPFSVSGRESCGLILKDLSGQLTGGKSGWRLSDFHLATTNSEIKQGIGWVQSSNGSHIEMEVLSTRIDPADIFMLTGYKLPSSAPIELSGNLIVERDRIQAKQLWAQWGNNLRISSNLIASNWNDEKKWNIKLQEAEIFARATPLSKWFGLPAGQQVTLSKIGYAQLRGKGEIAAEQASFWGNLRTQLGTLTGSGSARYPAKQLASYQASLKGELNGLQTAFPEWGVKSSSVTVNLAGKGTTFIQASGELTALQTTTYRFAPIRFNLDANDPVWMISLNTQDSILNGVVSIRAQPFTEKSSIGMDARLEWMDLTALGWNQDGLTLKGSLQGNFYGNGIENVNGTLQGYSLELSKNGVPLSLQEFDLSLQQDGKKRNLSLRSNELEASIRGNFSWENLPNLGKSLAHRYFPSWIEAPSSTSLTDQVEFSMRSYNIESYTELLHLPVSGLSNSSVEANVNAGTGIAQLKAVVPKLQFQSNVFQNTVLDVEGVADSLHLLASVEKIYLNDSINIPEARIELSARRDTADLRLMAGLSQAVDKADIRSRFIAYPDGLQLDLSPSTFLVQGKLWSIDQNGQLVIRKGQPALGNLSMQEGDQRISVRTIPSESGTDNDIEVSIESLNLHDIAPFFLPTTDLEGLVNAKVRIVDPAGNIRIEADTIQTRLLRFDADSIGELGASLSFDPRTKKLIARGQTLNQAERLHFDAKILLDGSVDSNQILLEARAYPINILERFLGDLFSDIRGTLTGTVELLGDLNNPSLYGNGRLNGAGLRVRYTNCFYSIQDADIDITPTLIDLDGWVLKDSATGNPIYIRGGIAHESFQNMYYDLSATTRSLVTNTDRPVLLLNTGRTQEEVYYGTARGTLSLQLRGPQSNLVLNLQARASDRDSSYITLLSEDGRESGEADFMVEREYGREMSGNESLGGADNFTVDMEITATPLVNAKVVLDELTGDVIRGRGSGTLKIRSGSNEPLTLRGRYNIEEGNYLFTFQSFFKKPFEIRKGGQHYVEWVGDPVDANIKLEAMYKADNVSFAPLASSLNLGSGLNNARGDVFVNAELTGKLFQPQIKFSLGFPPNGVVDRNQELSLLVNQLQKNPNELNRQVTYLIVFNSFAPSELAGDPSGAGIGVSTISGVLLNVLSDQINKLLGNLLKSDKYTINLNTSLYNRDWMDAGNNALNLGSNINFSVGRSFFKNGFIISGGLGFDAPLGQSAASANLSQSIQLLPDVTMEWLINPSGSLRVGFFYRKSNDFLTNNTNPMTARRTGGSLSYQKDYDQLGDLFRGLLRKKKKKD